MEGNVKKACPSCRVLLDLPDERVIIECSCGAILVAKPRIAGRDLVEREERVE